MFSVFRRIRENHRGAIDGEDTHAVVGDERRVAVDKITYSILKIDENLMGQFLTSLTQGAWSNHPLRYIEFVDRLEKLIKFILGRSLDEIRKVEGQQWEGENTVTDEIIGRCTMLLLKIFEVKGFFDNRNQLNAKLG